MNESQINLGPGLAGFGLDIAKALNDQGMSANYHGLETHGHESLHSQITMTDRVNETIKIRLNPPSSW